jgi:hypothetical protein
MGIYEFMYDCRDNEEKSAHNSGASFDGKCLCYGMWSTYSAGACFSNICSKHKVVVGNRFKYYLHRFYADHGVAQQRYRMDSVDEAFVLTDVEVLDCATMMTSNGQVQIVQFLVEPQCIADSLKPILQSHVRYFTCFGNNEDTPSYQQRDDGKCIITLPFSNDAVARQPMTDPSIQYCWETNRPQRIK